MAGKVTKSFFLSSLDKVVERYVAVLNWLDCTGIWVGRDPDTTLSWTLSTTVIEFNVVVWAWRLLGMIASLYCLLFGIEVFRQECRWIGPLFNDQLSLRNIMSYSCLDKLLSDWGYPCNKPTKLRKIWLIERLPLLNLLGYVFNFGLGEFAPLVIRPDEVGCLRNPKLRGNFTEI